MNTNTMHDEIRELNLAYLMLAQQMLRDDRAAAIYRLGIGEEVADGIADFDPLGGSGIRGGLGRADPFARGLVIDIVVTGIGHDRVPQARRASSAPSSAFSAAGIGS